MQESEVIIDLSVFQPSERQALELAASEKNMTLQEYISFVLRCSHT